MSRFRIFMLIGMALLFGIINELHADVVFTAIADTPYNRNEAKKLLHHLAETDKRSAFTIHLGDIKSGKSKCDEIDYIKVASILKKATNPVFIVPGDNEWNDCKDPYLAWRNWAKYFMHFDQLWPLKFNVTRQNNHPENFSFVYQKVLFIGINMVGGRVHDQAEWKQRLIDNLEWTVSLLTEKSKHVNQAVIFGHAGPSKNHKNYFDGLKENAVLFAKPILYIHGDGHHWTKSHPFKAKNILRVQLDMNRPVTVTVTNNQKSPFIFDRR